MAIKLQQLHQYAQDNLGASGSEFDRYFIDAVNCVSRDVLSDIGLDVDEINTISGELDIASKHYDVYKLGIISYMVKAREWAKKADASCEMEYRRAIGRSQYFYAEDEGLKGGTMASTWGE